MSEMKNSTNELKSFIQGWSSEKIRDGLNNINDPSFEIPFHDPTGEYRGLIKELFQEVLFSRDC